MQAVCCWHLFAPSPMESSCSFLATPTSICVSALGKAQTSQTRVQQARHCGTSSTLASPSLRKRRITTHLRILNQPKREIKAQKRYSRLTVKRLLVPTTHEAHYCYPYSTAPSPKESISPIASAAQSS